MVFYSYFPEMQQAPDGMYWGNFFYQSTPHVAIQTDQWHCLEFELKANTPGVHDGEQRMWINGLLKGDVRNLRWRDTTNLRINAIQITNSGGGPKVEYKWFDNIVVSRERIGCLGTTTPPPAPTPIPAPTNLKVQ
jgi:hypothetical protein